MREMIPVLCPGALSMSRHTVLACLGRVVVGVSFSYVINWFGHFFFFVLSTTSTQFLWTPRFSSALMMASFWGP